MEAYVWSVLFVSLGIASLFGPKTWRSEREQFESRLPLWGKPLREGSRWIGFGLIAFGILWALIGLSGAKPNG